MIESNIGLGVGLNMPEWLYVCSNQQKEVIFLLANNDEKNEKKERWWMKTPDLFLGSKRIAGVAFALFCVKWVSGFIPTLSISDYQYFTDSSYSLSRHTLTFPSIEMVDVFALAVFLGFAVAVLFLESKKD